MEASQSSARVSSSSFMVGIDCADKHGDKPEDFLTASLATDAMADCNSADGTSSLSSVWPSSLVGVSSTSVISSMSVSTDSMRAAFLSSGG